MEADKRRFERVLEVGDWVYLKVQPYRKVSMVVKSNIKLDTKYFGPFQIIQRIGAVPFKLQLPAGSLIYPIFYVSQLKKKLGPEITTQIDPPFTGLDGQVLAEPVAVIDKRVIKRNNQAVS